MPCGFTATNKVPVTTFRGSTGLRTIVANPRELERHTRRLVNQLDRLGHHVTLQPSAA